MYVPAVVAMWCVHTHLSLTASFFSQVFESMDELLAKIPMMRSSAMASKADLLRGWQEWRGECCRRRDRGDFMLLPELQLLCQVREGREGREVMTRLKGWKYLLGSVWRGRGIHGQKVSPFCWWVGSGGWEASHWNVAYTIEVLGFLNTHYELDVGGGGTQFFIIINNIHILQFPLHRPI